MKTKPIIIFGLAIFSLFFLTPSLYSQEHQHTEQTQPPVQTGESETEDEESAVEIPIEKQQLIGVKTAEAAMKPMQKTIRTVGRVEYDERKLATINTKFEGWIEKLYADSTGKYVKKGEPLAEIYSPELVATQQEFINALKWAKQYAVRSTQYLPTGQAGAELNSMFSEDAEKLVDSARQRLKLWDISDEQIKKIEETGTPIKTLILHSPVNGYIIQKMALQGMRVMPGEKLFDIADLSSVWVISDIYEFELPLIKVGQTAKISLSYFPGKEFSSTVDYIYPALAGETRTARVRFTIPNSSAQLKPQMFTNVEIKVDMGKRLAIPNDAVIDTGTRQIVYVDKGEGNFEPHEVTLGLKADGMTEVIEGLEEGERVASSGTFLIDSEAQLKGVKPVKRK
jgi:Cu(I)/Ag(I) efflux system membrane fusion protein